MSNLPSTLQILMALLNDRTVFEDIVKAIPEQMYSLKTNDADGYSKCADLGSFVGNRELTVQFFYGTCCGGPYSLITYTISHGGIDGGERILCHSDSTFGRPTDPLQQAENDKYATDVAGMILSYLRKNGIISELA